MRDSDKDVAVEIEKDLPEMLKQLEVLINKIGETNDYIYGIPNPSPENKDFHPNGISEEILNEEITKRKHKKWKQIIPILEIYKKIETHP